MPQPPVAPAPVRAPHRKARLTPTSGTTVGSQTGTSTTGSAHHGANGGHHHPPTGTGSTGTGEGTGSTGTAIGTSETTGTGTTRSPGTKAHPKKRLVAEEQLPNF
jgi:hypothetical protein